MRIIKGTPSNKSLRRQQVDSAIGFGMGLDRQSEEAIDKLIANSTSANAKSLRRFLNPPKPKADKITRRFNSK